jgi:hypothetical protein
LVVLERRLAFAVVVCPLLVPAGAGRHIKVFAGVLVFVFQVAGNVRCAQAAGLALLLDLFAALVKQVAGALEEQHAEDVFLVLTGIHVAAQVIAGGEQQAFKLREREFGDGHGGGVVSKFR